MRSRNRLALLLAILVSALLCLLATALWESNEDGRVAVDINHSASLSYHCLYLYGAFRERGTKDDPARFPDSRGVLAEMAETRNLLRQRYPTEVSRTDEAWRAFLTQIRDQGTVDWATANTLRLRGEALSAGIQNILQQRLKRTTQLYAFGLAVTAFALPWAAILFAELRDIQRRLSEENAERERVVQRFVSLFTGLPVACFTFDRNGKVQIWNCAAERVFDVPASQAVGRRVEEVLSLPADVAVRDPFLRSIQGEEFDNVEWRMAVAGGKAKRLVSNVFPLRDEGTEITGGVSATLDITALKQAEERLDSVLTGLRCIVWDATVDRQPDSGVFDWTLQIWNEKAAQQIVPLDIQGMNYVRAWKASRETDQEQMDITSSRAFMEGLSGYTQEFRCRDRFGAVHWLREDVHIQKLGTDRWRAIGVCTDITARKETEDRLQAMTRELERSNAALQDFASIASHDLKEPLRKIHTFGGMIARKTEHLPPEAQSYLERMMAAVNRMQTLIDGLLSYSRITAKGNAFTQTDLNEVIKGVLNDLEIRIQETGATVLVPPLPSLFADTLQMRQLFQNLIGNALKFHREGEPPCIEITYERNGGRHIVTVRDNGIGFAPKDAERIFEVFERLDGSGREGTGIGLAICRKIAERHGGTLTASGTPGAGATFTLVL